MSIVSVYDARAGLSRLIDQALAGEDVVISRKGKPVVRLVPVDAEATEQPRKRRLGVLKGYMEVPPDSAFFDPLPDEFLKEFYESPIFPEDDAEPVEGEAAR
jgi:prevent-host-death family protein